MSDNFLYLEDKIIAKDQIKSIVRKGEFTIINMKDGESISVPYSFEKVSLYI